MKTPRSSLSAISAFVTDAYNLYIVDVIDATIPKTRHDNPNHSHFIKAIVPNGLEFIGHRFYLLPDFFDDIAIERHVGEGITRELLNNDVFGRTLDAVAAFGPTELFTEIVATYLLSTEFGS